MRAINTPDNATHQGDISPKKRAISLPLLNPAPIEVPMNKKHTLRATFIVEYMQLRAIT
jgi:hypothetical protein